MTSVSTKPAVPLTKDITGLAALFLTSGSTHLVNPTIPQYTPRRTRQKVDV
jgi:hypothetical protein